MQKIFRQLLPFIFIGIALVAFAFGILLLAYLFLFGALVGIILFIISWIREKFFPTKNIITQHKKKGRIIDSNDWKKM
jgi:hypothetical protein